MKGIALLAVLVLLCSCGRVATISETEDPFTREVVIEYATGLKLAYEGQGDLLGLLGQMSEYGINIRGRVSLENASKSSTFLIMYYYGPDWFFIQEEGTLQLLYTTGSSTTLDGQDRISDTFVSGGDVWCEEMIFIPVSDSVIDSLCNGNVSLIRLNGRNVYQNLTIPELTLQRLNTLWARIQTRRDGGE